MWKILILAVALIPTVGAVHTDLNGLFDPGEIFESEAGLVGAGHMSTVNPIAGEQLNFTFLNQPLTNRETRDHNVLFLVSQSVTLPDSATGTWRVWLELDGVEVDCEWFIRTQTGIGFGSTVITPSFVLACSVNELPDGVHVVTVNTESFMGSPPGIQASMVSVVVYRQDQVVVEALSTFESFTGLSALEFALFPGLAALGVVLWSRSTDLAVRSFGAVLVMLAGVLLLLFGLEAGLGSIWSGTVAFVIILLVVGGYLFVRMFLDEFREGSV